MTPAGPMVLVANTVEDALGIRIKRILISEDKEEERREKHKPLKLTPEAFGTA